VKQEQQAEMQPKQAPEVSVRSCQAKVSGHNTIAACCALCAMFPVQPAVHTAGNLHKKTEEIVNRGKCNRYTAHRRAVSRHRQSTALNAQV
jgi:hypothetical protein